jgi:hypothetical protein
MLRRMPIKRKRDTPRRKAPERVPARVKRKASSPSNAAELRHWARLREMGCVGCGNPDVERHHSLTAKGKRCRRDHRFVVPLCAACHRGPSGVHGLGSERAFGEMIGTDLGMWAVRQWETSCE